MDLRDSDLEKILDSKISLNDDHIIKILYKLCKIIQDILQPIH